MLPVTILAPPNALQVSSAPVAGECSPGARPLASSPLRGSRDQRRRLGFYSSHWLPICADKCRAGTTSEAGPTSAEQNNSRRWFTSTGIQDCPLGSGPVGSRWGSNKAQSKISVGVRCDDEPPSLALHQDEDRPARPPGLDTATRGWERFLDPDETFYRTYVREQWDKEKHVNAALCRPATGQRGRGLWSRDGRRSTPFRPGIRPRRKPSSSPPRRGRRGSRRLP